MQKRGFHSKSSVSSITGPHTFCWQGRKGFSVLPDPGWARMELGQLLAHVSPQLTTIPSPGTHSVATYRSIELAFAVHGHEESTFDTKYAHHTSFHRRNFQQTYTGDTEIRGTKGCALEHVVTVPRSPTGCHPQCASPHPSTAVGVHRAPNPTPHTPHAVLCPMLGGSSFS